MKVKKIKNTFVAIVLATGTLAGSMNSAHADLTFGVFTKVEHTNAKAKNRGHKNHNKGGYNKYSNGDYYNPNYGGYYSSEYSNYNVHNYQPRRKACNPRRAMRIAYRHFGLYEPHIKRINQKKIVVRGYNYGHPAKIVFKRTRHGCKVIKTRGI